MDAIIRDAIGDAIRLEENLPVVANAQCLKFPRASAALRKFTQLRHHVAESVEDGVRIAEFPTTVVAARTSHEAGLAVLMGAPNVVRGGSHSGNVSAIALAEAGVLDVLSSDYIPFALLQAAFLLPQQVASVSLPQAIAMVTATPARAVGLADRGEIATGRRADLVRVRLIDGTPVVKGVWRQGERVG